MSIPCILHQTWKTAELPTPFRAFQTRWRALHPQYTYRLWTDADNDRFVRDQYPALYKLYRSFEREIFRADMVRYLYLHHYGGVYIDLDVEPLRPLDGLLSNRSCLIGSEPAVHARKLWNQAQLVSNAVMASTPGHPFWLQMLDEIALRAAQRHKNPVSTTGPISLHAAYQRCGKALAVTLAEPDAFFPVPDLDNTQLRLSAAMQEHFRNMIELGTYPTASWGVHHWAHTWIPTQAAKRLCLRVRAHARDLPALLCSRKTIDEVSRPSRYRLQFPERAFPPRPSRAALYQHNVHEGYVRARKQSISVLVLLHNRIDLALMLRARLTALLAPFGQGRVWMISDDSSDGTAEVMADWQRADPGRVVQVSAPAQRDACTVYARMARLRNALLRRSQSAQSDLTCVLDGDLAGPISLDGVMHAVAYLGDESDDGPDAVAAFGINNWGGLPGMFPFLGYSYYDPIAFRQHTWRRSLSDAQVRLRLGALRRGDAPLPVKSAFGGMVMYKSAALRGLRYDEHTDDCEHVSLHHALAARGSSMVVDPSLLLLSGRQGHHRTAEASRAAVSSARQYPPRSMFRERQDGLDRIDAHATREHAGVTNE